MNRDKSIKLWKEGKDAWNKWANGMLAECKKLEEAGKWDAEEGVFGYLESKTPETKKWLTNAKADFSSLWLLGRKKPPEGEMKDAEIANNLKSISVDTDGLDFQDFIFPSDVTFVNTVFDATSTNFMSSTFRGGAHFQLSTFRGSADFQSSTFRGSAHFGLSTFRDFAKFESSTFRGSAHFLSSTFRGIADFLSSTFRGSADFGSSTFRGSAYFWFSTFRGTAKFRSSTFRDFADFGSSTFRGSAYFQSSTFRDFADFGSSTFRGSANFEQAQFERPVSFKDARFEDAAKLRAITSAKSFALTNTRFAHMPDFSETSFHAPPVLDDLTVSEPLSQHSWQWFKKSPNHIPRNESLFHYWPVANSPTDARNFRALAKMAGEAKDHQNEMEFFAQELRCRRFWHDKPFGRGAGRFWLGLAYEKFSDFGRSFWRPFAGWLATSALFALLYGQMAKATDWSWSDALYLSIRHGLVISGLTRNDHMKSLLKNMYGTDIPALTMLAQPLISAIWIFLLLLAIRSQFKIK